MEKACGIYISKKREGKLPENYWRISLMKTTLKLLNNILKQIIKNRIYKVEKQ